jgi:hypothetical protein
LTRRRFLRSAGTVVALPFLESLARAGERPGLKVAFVYAPIGALPERWSVGSADGPLAQLSWTLAPLEDVKQHVNVISNLNNPFCQLDGAGHHARGASTWLTCQRLAKTSDNYRLLGRAARSIDQIIADRLSQGRPFRTLAMCPSATEGSGNCDSGYACSYVRNISWTSMSVPETRLSDPSQIFRMLFPSREKETGGRLAARRSVLDFVRGEAAGLNRALGVEDRVRLDRYLTGLRELEYRSRGDLPPVPASGERFRPSEALESAYQEHVDLLGELILLAFKADLTGVATLMLEFEASNRNYKQYTDIDFMHHDSSHHQGQEHKKEAYGRINRYHVARFARFLQVARDEQMLDQCLFVYGSNLGDGMAHNSDDLPLLLAGHGAGIAGGRHLRAPDAYAEPPLPAQAPGVRGCPLSNLWLTLAQRAGCDLRKFEDSTGTLAV